MFIKFTRVLCPGHCNESEGFIVFYNTFKWLGTGHGTTHGPGTTSWAAPVFTHSLSPDRAGCWTQMTVKFFLKIKNILNFSLHTDLDQPPRWTSLKFKSLNNSRRIWKNDSLTFTWCSLKNSRLFCKKAGHTCHGHFRLSTSVLPPNLVPVAYKSFKVDPDFPQFPVYMPLF